MRSEQEIKKRIALLVESIGEEPSLNPLDIESHINNARAMVKLVAIRELEWVLGARLTATNQS